MLETASPLPYFIAVAAVPDSPLTGAATDAPRGVSSLDPGRPVQKCAGRFFYAPSIQPAHSAAAAKPSQRYASAISARLVMRLIIALMRWTSG